MGDGNKLQPFFIGFLLALIAYDFLKDSILQFKTKESANFGTLAIIVTSISILVKEGLAQYAFYIGKKTKNISVKADGWHHRTDALSSIVVLIGIFFTNRFWWIDSVLGITIAFMLFYASFEIIKDTINKILGEEPGKELIEKINSFIQSNYHKSVYPHHYHIHNYVNNKELIFHIQVDNKMDVLSAHAIATNIEKTIKKELNIITAIHIEPRSFVQDGKYELNNKNDF